MGSPPKPDHPSGDEPTPPKESIFGYAVMLAPAIAALVGGLIVAFSTGDLWALAVVVIGGTVIGYVACAAVFFTVGHFLERRGALRGRAADAFFVLDLAIGGGAAIIIAVLATSGVEDAIKAIAAVLGLAILAVVALAVTN